MSRSEARSASGVAGEVADREARVGRAEVGGEDDAGVVVEGQDGRRAAAGRGAVAGLVDEPAARAARRRAGRRSSGRARSRRARSARVTAVAVADQPQHAPAPSACGCGPSSAMRREVHARLATKISTLSRRSIADFCLTSDISPVYVRATMALSGSRSRAPGSSAPSTRTRRAPAGGDARGRRRLDARAARAAAADASAPSAPSTRPRSWSRDPDVDVVHVCTPNHLHAAARRGRAGGRQARGLREAAGHRRSTGAQRLVDAAGGRRAVTPPCRSSTATTRRSARRASGSRAGETGAVHLLHGTYLQDWLLAPDDDNWRVDARARRRLARVRRHRLALVRPGRVRLRPPHHAALGARC